MALDVEQLLTVPVFRAFDVDSAGRVLCGSDESGSMQLVEIAPDGQRTPLTALEGSCEGRYIPGRRVVVVSHDDGGNERTQLSLLRLDDAGSGGPGPLVPLVHDPRFVHRLVSVDADRLCYLTNRRDGIEFDVVIRSVATGAEFVAYAGVGMMGQVAISPDERWLAVIVPAQLAMSSQVLVVDLTAALDSPARIRALTRPDEHAVVDRPQWLPDSSTLILSSNRDRDFIAIAAVEVAGNRWTWPVLDDAHDLAAWLAPDGGTMLVETNHDGASGLALHDVATGDRLRPIALPAVGTISGLLPEPSWAPDSRSIVASISSPRMPGDALLIDAGSGSCTALTASAAALGGATLTLPEAHRVPTPDGERIPCFVYRPAPGSDPSLDRASVVFIHGGPEGQSKRNYNPFVQALSQAGYTVVVPNVRGSVGYGKRWYSLDDVRLRLDSVADLAAVKIYLEKIGLDDARCALWGGSYGGYMVLAGLAFQPLLWAAGVDVVGMSSLVTFLENTSAYRRSLREREYGSLAEDRDFLIEASPLTHITDVRSPLFVIHGANDPRVPVSEAHQLHSALTANGVECELLVYGDEGHGLAKRVNRLDAYPKAFAFLGRHLAKS